MRGQMRIRSSRIIISKKENKLNKKNEREQNNKTNQKRKRITELDSRKVAS